MRKIKILVALLISLALAACGTPEQVSPQPLQLPNDSAVIATQEGGNVVIQGKLNSPDDLSFPARLGNSPQAANSCLRLGSLGM